MPIGETTIDGNVNLGDLLREVLADSSQFSIDLKDKLLATADIINDKISKKIDDIKIKDEYTLSDLLGIKEEDFKKTREKMVESQDNLTKNINTLSDKVSSSFKEVKTSKTKEDKNNDAILKSMEKLPAAINDKINGGNKFFEEEGMPITIGDISGKALAKLGATGGAVGIGSGMLTKQSQPTNEIFDKVKQGMFSGGVPSILARFTGIAFLIGGLLWAAFDGLKGFFRADQWGTSKISAIFGGLMGGSSSGRPGMEANSAKWALYGAGVGTLIAPGVGTIIGALAGVAYGALMGYIGGQRIAQGFDKIGNMFKEIPSWYAANVAPKLEKAGKWIKDVLWPKYLHPFIDFIYDKLAEFFEWSEKKLDEASQWLGKKENQDKIKKFFVFIGDILKSFFAFIGNSIKDAWEWISSEENKQRVKTFFSFIGEKLKDFFGWVSDGVESAGKWLQDPENKEKVNRFFKFIGDNLKVFFSFIGDKLSDAGDWLKDPKNQQKVKDFFIFIGTNVRDFYLAIGSTLKDAIAWLTDPENLNRIKNLLSLFGTVFKNVFNATYPAVESALTWLSDYNNIQSIVVWIDTIIEFFKNLGKTFAKIGNMIGGPFRALMEDILTLTDSIGRRDWVQAAKSAGSLLTFGGATYGKNLAQDYIREKKQEEDAKDASFRKSQLERIEREKRHQLTNRNVLVEKALDKAKLAGYDVKLSGDASLEQKEVLVQSLIKQGLIKMAKGGVVNQPTIAMVGEAGREAVIPLEKDDMFKRMVDERVDRLADALKEIKDSVDVMSSVFMQQLNKTTNQGPDSLPQTPIPDAIDVSKPRHTRADNMRQNYFYGLT